MQVTHGASDSIFPAVRLVVPSRTLHIAGIAVLVLFVSWAVTSMSWLAIACGCAGLAYSAAMMIVPDLMPRLRLDAEKASADRVFRWSQRLMGVASVPLWTLVLRNRPIPFLPSRNVLLPVAIGVAVAVAFQIAGPRSRT